jgi:hypothetical protein
MIGLYTASPNLGTFPAFLYCMLAYLYSEYENDAYRLLINEMKVAEQVPGEL